MGAVRGFQVEGDSVALSVGTSAAETVFPAAWIPSGYRFYNAGSTPCFVRIEDSGDASTATSCPIAPLSVEVLYTSNKSRRISAIRSSGSGTLHVTPGHGI